MSDLVQAIVQLAEQAGAAIMEIYAQDFSVETKGDNSPLTQADLAAHRLIVAGLAELTPDIPVLSEEAADLPWATRQTWSRYWLVDPLDGTREFIKKNGEFTVNISLIENHLPVLGVVHAPALDAVTWYAEVGRGAFVRRDKETQPLAVRRPATAPLRVAASRSHLDERTAAFLSRLGDCERFGLGSSLKFCRIAEAAVDLYPRFGPTSEWDTAAGQCVLEVAGGAVLHLDGRRFEYNHKESLLNSDFIAVGDVTLPWQGWLHD